MLVFIRNWYHLFIQGDMKQIQDEIHKFWELKMWNDFLKVKKMIENEKYGCYFLVIAILVVY